MGRYDQGILGKFFGKVGTVIGSKWRGINYMKSKGPSRRNNSSPAQLEQQAKFAVAVNFTRRLKSLFRITYKNSAVNMTTRNSALSNILANAIIGVYPDFSLDYSQILVSRGSLDQVTAHPATVLTGNVNYTWEPPHGDIEEINPNDRSILVVFCPATQQYISKKYASTRASGAASIDAKAFMGEAQIMKIL